MNIAALKVEAKRGSRVSHSRGGSLLWYKAIEVKKGSWAYSWPSIWHISVLEVCLLDKGLSNYPLDWIFYKRTWPNYRNGAKGGCYTSMKKNIILHYGKGNLEYQEDMRNTSLSTREAEKAQSMLITTDGLSVLLVSHGIQRWLLGRRFTLPHR